MTSPLLSVDGVGVRFPRGGWFSRSTLRAAHNVSFAVERGEVVALVGESGSGKSTLGRVIAGLQHASAGTISFEGEPLPILPSTARDPRTRQRIQMVFQDPYSSLNPVHTLLHHIARPLHLHGRAGADVRATAAQLLDQVGLSPGIDFLDRRPHELSGGQRQRVAIARALAPGPSVLVADEPTASLDVSVRMEVLLLLRRLQREQGLGVLFITHDLAAAQFMADRIVVLYAGQVMEQGPTARVLSTPSHPYTQLLIAAARHKPGPLPARSGTPPVIDPPPGCPFAARCHAASSDCLGPTLAPRALPRAAGEGPWWSLCQRTPEN